MLRIQIIGLAIVSALLMSAVVAGSASAAEELPHEWLIGGKLLGSPVKVHSLGLLLLTDDTAPGIIGTNPVSVHCHGFDSGTVGPHALDLVQTVTTELLKGSDKIPCTFDKQGACNSSPAPLALAVNLPWHTQITLVNTEVRDMLMSGGNGNPGWSVTCATAAGEAVDVCTTALTTTGLKSVAGGVEAIFDEGAGSSKADCKLNIINTELRKGAGLVRGFSLTESPSSTEKLTFF